MRRPLILVLFLFGVGVFLSFAYFLYSRPILGATREVSGDSFGALLPDGILIVAASQKNNTIAQSRSVDEGKTLMDAGVILPGEWPGLAVVGETVYVSAGDRLKRTVSLVRSVDGGNHFDPPIRVFAWDQFQNDPPDRNLLIDTFPIPLSDGSLLVSFTQVIGLSNVNDEGIYTIHLYRSTDDGKTWSFLSDVMQAPRGIHLEDVRYLQLSNGDLLASYEWEEQEGGTSHIEQKRSTDGGKTWGPAAVLWDEGAGIDIEQGGYLPISHDELWFFASHDAEDTEHRSYSGAKIYRKISKDGGRTWSRVTPLLSSTNHISFGGVRFPSGKLSIFSIRFWKESGQKIAPRTFSVYILP